MGQLSGPSKFEPNNTSTTIPMKNANPIANGIEISFLIKLTSSRATAAADGARCLTRDVQARGNLDVGEVFDADG
jgi:hypothetical protein